MFHFLHNHYQALIRGLIRIRSNWLGSFMMFLVIGITLSLPSIGLLFLDNASQLSNKIKYEAEISVFLTKDISEDQIEFIESGLKKNSLIKNIHFEPKQDAWDKLQTKLKLSSLEGGISENPLPDAFFISLNTLDSDQIANLINDLKTIEGIKEIVIDGGWIKKLRSILYLIKVSVYTLGALLIAVLIIVISNTIRLQTLTYQDEIEVSRLIGATNSFIRRPFTYTGIIYGFGGGLITLAILKVIVIIFNLITHRIEDFFGGLIVIQNFNLEESILLIFTAMLAGWLASFIAAKQAIYRLEKNI
jgi:cell division transport system permease protein